MKAIIYFLMLVFLLFACNKNRSYEYRDKMASIEQESMAPVPPSQSFDNSLTPVKETQNTEINKKKIIKDGRMGIKVIDLEKTKKEIDTLISSYGGYYANENFNNSDYESTYFLNIRIPLNNFEKCIAEIESGIGEILYKSIDTRDVTEQFIDLETRLKNKRSYLQRYNQLLKQAKTVKEILEIEEEIESTEGRLKYLGDLVAYSSLELMINKQKEFKYRHVQRDKFGERLKQSLSNGWIAFIDFLLFLIKIWPFWIIITTIYYLWRKFKKSKK